MTTKSEQRKSYETDITELYYADNYIETEIAFESIFGTLPSHQELRPTYQTAYDLGLGDDGFDEGVYFIKENKHCVYVMCDPSDQMTETLKIEAGSKFLVYTDSYEQEGPFSGEPDPVNDIQIFDTWEEAKAEFVNQIHAE